MQRDTSLQCVQLSWSHLLSTRSYTASRWYLGGAHALTERSLEDSIAPAALGLHFGEDTIGSKHPPAEPGAFFCEPLEAA